MKSARRALGFALLGASAIVIVALGVLREPETARTRDPLPRAIITVDAQSPGAAVSPYLYGLALEWIDGGNGILDPTTGQLRPEIVEPLKALRIPVWRFPGGIFSDHYHWRDGVGPPDRRPRGRNPVDGTEHAHVFGTDEFIALCRATGAAALVTANAGTGTLAELLAWQAYFMSRQFPVRDWEIGNEIYLADDSDHPAIPGNDRRIFKTPDRYAQLFGAWRAALRERDASVSIGAIAGTSNTSAANRAWLPTLVSTTTGEIDFIALHNAFAPLILESYDFSNASNRRAAYESMFARAQMTGDDIAAVNSQWVRTRGGAPPRIAITEHFPLFGAGGGPAQLQAILDQSRTQAAALYTASLIHEFMRREVWMANYNLATSKWFGALLTDTERGIVKTPTYHVYDLYRNHFGTALIAVTAEGPQFDTRQVGSVAARKDVPYLDVIASKDGAGNVYLAVINRSGERPVEAEIRFANPVSANATVMTLAAQSLDAINGPALGPTVRADANIDIRSSRWTGKPGATYAFPAASVTIFRWAM